MPFRYPLSPRGPSAVPPPCCCSAQCDAASDDDGPAGATNTSRSCGPVRTDGRPGAVGDLGAWRTRRTDLEPRGNAGGVSGQHGWTDWPVGGLRDWRSAPTVDCGYVALRRGVDGVAESTLVAVGRVRGVCLEQGWGTGDLALVPARWSRYPADRTGWPHQLDELVAGWATHRLRRRSIRQRRHLRRRRPLRSGDAPDQSPRLRGVPHVDPRRSERAVRPPR